MPKIYEYFGLIILFYSNEHEPIHVHGKYQNKESKAEFILNNGKIIEIRFTRVRGKNPLTQTQEKKFKVLIAHYKKEIVQKWIDYFVLHKPIKSEKITKKI
ncbi:hypothetical protein MNBD_UNCLBAC01-396 [hydrothermal vent metagenome]|uniref:DUF4160 domain-containing protein n=1 Tax=hydrothermal vent metagenome TaxID=652676 RepID=A0A3B1DQH1_9ZZZZ